MGGGKGGGTYYSEPARTYVDPVDGTTYDSSAALNEHITQRKAQEKLDSDAAKTTADTTATTAQNTFNTNRDTAYNNALDAVKRTFSNKGIDVTPYLESNVIPELNTRKSTIQNLDPNPSSAFPTTLGETIINNLTTGARDRATTAYGKAIPTNYSNTLIADTADDPYISQIVSEQFDPLTAQLGNVYKRGTLNEVGYNQALNTLNQKRSAAQETVGNLGSNILSTDRKGIDDIITEGRNAISNLGLSDAFDPTTYSTRAQSRATDYLNTLPGALRNAVGGTQFANLGELINAGGASQGAINPRLAEGTAAVGGNTTDDTRNKKRGLGNTGAF